MLKPVYKRIVLKLSGEALQGKNTHGIDPEVLKTIASLSVEAKKEMEKVVSESAVELAFSTGEPDFPIGNWMTDAMRRQAGTDLAFQNSAGIRAGLGKGIIKIRKKSPSKTA